MREEMHSTDFRLIPYFCFWPCSWIAGETDSSLSWSFGGGRGEIVALEVRVGVGVRVK